MAMLDYGVLVKKNNEIIPFEYFKNFTTLRYKYDAETEEVVIDETLVEGLYSQFSMAGNNFALFGDKNALVGFYKDRLCVALNGKLCSYDDTDIYPELKGKKIKYEWQDNAEPMEIYEYLRTTFRPVKVNIPGFRKFTITKIDSCVYRAKFYIGNDKYDVLYGYGIDSIDFMLNSRKSYYKRTSFFYNSKNELDIRHSNKVNKEDRKVYNFIKRWSENKV